MQGCFEVLTQCFCSQIAAQARCFGGGAAQDVQPVRDSSVVQLQWARSAFAVNFQCWRGVLAVALRRMCRQYGAVLWCNCSAGTMLLQ